MEVEDDAAGAVGLQHRFNSQLPYADRIPAENERLLADVKDALAKFATNGDFKLLLKACSGQFRSAISCWYTHVWQQVDVAAIIRRSCVDCVLLVIRSNTILI